MFRLGGLVVVAAALISASGCGHHGTESTVGTARLSYRPNSTTPGALNPAVTQKTLATTVCRAGWSSEQRPPSSFTSHLRDQELAASYSYEHLAAPDVEEDHRVPISVGGAPADPKNLWPQPHVAHGPDGQMAGSIQKDGLEWYAYRHVCGKASPTISLATARSYFLGDWYHWFVALGRPKAPTFFR